MHFLYLSSYTSWHASLCVFTILHGILVHHDYCSTMDLDLLCSICQLLLQPMSCLSAESEQTTFSTAASVGVTSVVMSTITLTVGFLAGVLVYHCISKHQSQSSKPDSSFQQQTVVPQQRAGPEYEEVVELKENVAYGPAQQSIELKACEAYMPIQH